MLCFLQGIKEVTNVNAFEKFKVIQKWIVRKEITRYCWVSTNGLEPPLFWVPSGFFSESLAQASFSSSIQQSTNTYKGTPKLLRWTNQACIECILQKSVIWHRQMHQTLGFLWFPDSSTWQHLDELGTSYSCIGSVHISQIHGLLHLQVLQKLNICSTKETTIKHYNE